MTPTNTQQASNPTTYAISGMTCGHCARTVERAARDVPGVTGARVDFAARTLTVEGDVPAASIAAAVEEAGYAVEA